MFIFHTKLAADRISQKKNIKPHCKAYALLYSIFQYDLEPVLFMGFETILVKQTKNQSCYFKEENL